MVVESAADNGAPVVARGVNQRAVVTPGHQEHTAKEHTMTTRQGDKQIRILPVELTEEELVTVAQNMAAMMVERTRLETEFKNTAATHRLKVKEMTAQIDALTTIVNDGAEGQEVECEWQLSETKDGPQLELVRLDTEESIERRDAPPQAELPLAADDAADDDYWHDDEEDDDAPEAVQ